MLLQNVYPSLSKKKPRRLQTSIVHSLNVSVASRSSKTIWYQNISKTISFKIMLGLQNSAPHFPKFLNLELTEQKRCVENFSSSDSCSRSTTVNAPALNLVAKVDKRKFKS